MTGVARCLVTSNLAVFIETSLKSSFWKFDHEPVVKSPIFVPIANAKSVSLDRLLYEPYPRHPIAPI